MILIITHLRLTLSSRSYLHNSPHHASPRLRIHTHRQRRRECGGVAQEQGVGDGGGEEEEVSAGGETEGRCPEAGEEGSEERRWVRV
jgi:hypothetical protein